MQYEEYFFGLQFLREPERAGALASVYDPAAMTPFFDHPNIANPITFTTVIPNSGDPSRPCPGVPADQVYDEQTNPGGVRCTLQDYMVNAFGRDEQGWARRGFDNVGVQYGLKGLRQGLISPAQFADFNAHIGGGDLDLNLTAERTAADPIALRAPLSHRRDQLGEQPRPGRDHRSARPRSRRVPRRLPHLRDAGAARAQLRYRRQPDPVARAWCR